MAFVLAALVCGCRSGPPTPTEAGIDLEHLLDPGAKPVTRLLQREDLERIKEDVLRNPPPVLPRRQSILVLSGGGSNGAYTAGVLNGWSETGTRPQFDVVTGVSVGALIGSMAFLGPEQDANLKWFSTTLTTRDVYRRKPLLIGLFSESLARSDPLAENIAQIVTPAYLERVATEHGLGRRFYVGTTDLDGHRLVIWDMGAIASQRTPQSADLYRKILLASASIPVLLPPVYIPVEVDGKLYEERHIDGNTTSALFLRLPLLHPGQRNYRDKPYFGSDLYAIVAGKLFAEAEPVRLMALSVAVSSVSTVTFSQQRDELFKLYVSTVMNGMRFHLTAIPDEYPDKLDSTKFDTEKMARLFEEGRRLVLTGKAWRDLPPRYARGEQVAVRAGTRLTVSPPGPQGSHEHQVPHTPHIDHPSQTAPSAWKPHVPQAHHLPQGAPR